MTEQIHDAIPVDESAQAHPGRRSRPLTVALLALAVVASGIGIALLIGESGGPAAPKPLDRADPSAVAHQFAVEYARHDPQVCELLTAQLRPGFSRDGRCSGSATGPVPTVTILFARTCGDRTGVQMQVTPPGAFGSGFAMVSLASSGVTPDDRTQWSVASVVPFAQRDLLQPYACAPTSTSYGG